jgi:hypothetical protein
MTSVCEQENEYYKTYFPSFINLFMDVNVRKCVHRLPTFYCKQQQVMDAFHNN